MGKPVHKRKRQLVIAAELEWGTDAQIGMVQEECNELAGDLNKFKRGRKNREEIAGEVADVEIMLDFMRVYLTDELVDAAVDRKLDRLEGRLKSMKARGR